jgi:hypothetical protein
VRRDEQLRHVQAGELLAGAHDTGVRLEALAVSDHLIDSAEAKRGHDLAHLLGEHEAEVDHVLRLARELLAQDRVLGGDADRAGVEVALAHHNASHHDKGRRRHAVLFGTEQRRDRQIATGLQRTVRLHDDLAAQIVQHERLVGLRQTELPRETAVLDRGPARSASATVVTGDQNVISQTLGDTRRNNTDAHLGDKLHRDASGGVRVLQVRDELLEVLNGVDVVVRRR